MNYDWYLLVALLWGIPTIAMLTLSVWTGNQSLLTTRRGLSATFVPGYNLFILGVFCLVFAYGYARNKDKWKRAKT